MADKVRQGTANAHTDPFSQVQLTCLFKFEKKIKTFNFSKILTCRNKVEKWYKPLLILFFFFSQNIMIMIVNRKKLSHA